MPAGTDPDLLPQVLQACRTEGLLPAGTRVLVAVSGGADSMALASLLTACAQAGHPLDLTLAHLDHGWRPPAEGRADSEAVRALAARLGLRLHCVPRPLPALAPSEDAARRWRYHTLSQLAEAAGCQVVATGHHAGDQAETLLMRLLRGSGPVGLAGIPRSRPLGGGVLRVVRPLLDVEPERLKAWLRAQGIPWREDETNQDLSRDRAAIRARLAARGGTADLAALARRLRARLSRREEGIRARMATHTRHYPDAGAVRLSRSFLGGLSKADFTLALREAGVLLAADREGPWLTRRHVDCMHALLAEEGDLDLPRGLRLHVRGKSVWLLHREFRATCGPALRSTRVKRRAFDLTRHLAAGRPDRAALDAQAVGSDPRLRRLRRGDRFTPFGHTGGEVDVAAWMSRRGLPRWIRQRQLVVEGKAGLVWVVGERIDAHAAVTEESGEVLLLEIERAPGRYPPA